MRDLLVTVISVGCGLLALAGLIAVLVRRPIGALYLVAVAVVELVVLVQVVLAIVGLARGAEVDGIALFVAYLVFSAVVLPIGGLWAVGENDRWSGAVVAISALALVVTLVRMDAVWLGPGG